MTPTLKQLKLRPALWFIVLGGDPASFAEPRITMPNGDLWIYREYYDRQWGYYKINWHEHAINKYEFGGWL